MQYLIIVVITVVSLCISTLVTQSWGWGLLIFGLLLMITWLLWIIQKIWKKWIVHRWIAIWILVLVWVVTLIRLWSYDTHCRQTPDTVQWVVVVDNIWKSGESILVSQWDHHWIYRSSKAWTVWQSLTIYGATNKLQTCITTHTHIDMGIKQLSAWIKGGDFDYHRWLVMKWVDGYLQGKILQDNAISNITQEWISDNMEEDEINSINLMDQSQSNRDKLSLSTFKTLIISQIATLFPSSRSAWWVGGTLIGDKSMIADADYDLLIDSGLVHLIVVSGGNLALIILILGFVLWRIPLYLRYGLIVLWLIWYVMIVWTDSSVIRALLMALMTIGWIVIGRKRSFAGMLCIALMWLLWYQPLMIYDVWLWLSFSAVVGIYVCYHWTSWMTIHRQRWRAVQSVRNIIFVVVASTGAWLGTMPVLIWQFGSANLTSIVANSVTGIIASVTTVLELVVIGVNSISSGWIVQRWVWIVDHLVSVIYRIAKLTVDRWVWIGISSGRGMMIVVMSVVSIFVLLYHHTQKLRVEYLLEMKEE